MPATLPTFTFTSSATSVTSINAPLDPETRFNQLDDTYGAYLLGTFFGLILYGFSIHQTYRYTWLFPSDYKLIRLLVVAVICLETVHTVFTMHTCYYYLVNQHANGGALFTGVWSLNSIPVVMAMNMFVSQIFFARRVFLIGRRYRLVTYIAMLFFIVEIGFSIGAVYRALHVYDFWTIREVNHFLAAIFGSAVIGDTLLTGSLLLEFRRTRKPDPQSGTVIETLSVYTIDTGLFHDVLNVVSLILALAFPKELVHASVSIVTTRLYANTLLSVLNARKLSATFDIRVMEGGEGMNIIARANRQAAQERWNVPQVPDDLLPAAINIEVVTETASDKVDLAEGEFLFLKGLRQSVLD